MNSVIGFLLGLAICNGVMARNVNDGGSFKCADEHEMCECTGNVIYGKDSTWTAPMEADNEIACANGVFGDPIVGTVKECVCFPSFKCADENEVCNCKGSVRYGKGSTWTETMDVENEIKCTNGVFGDPIVGTVKECICLPSGTYMKGIQSWSKGEASNCKNLGCFYSKNGLQGCHKTCMENDECNLVNFCPAGADCTSGLNRCCPRHCTEGDHKMVKTWKGWDVYEKTTEVGS